MRQSGQDGARKGKQEGDGKAGWIAHPRLKMAGIALVVLGIIALLLSVSLLKWIFWCNVLALIIVAIGLLIMFMTRHR